MCRFVTSEGWWLCCACPQGNTRSTAPDRRRCRNCGRTRCAKPDPDPVTAARERHRRLYLDDPDEPAPPDSGWLAGTGPGGKAP